MSGIEKPLIEYILIVCCSCKRPIMLASAMKSVNRLKIPSGIKVELLIIDNDEEKSAMKVTEELSSEIKIPVKYVSEPRRGLAYARNRSLEEAINLGATHILNFDDDEFFDENCLEEHIKLYNENPDAYVCSGPVPSIFTEKFPSYITKNIVFKQESSKKTGTVKSYCAAGNVFFPVKPVKELNLRFSEEFIFSGGEDGDFFKQFPLNGYTIVWTKDAVIYESVSKSRANIPYILKKSKYNGYAGAFARFKTVDDKSKKVIYALKNAILVFISAAILIPSLIFGLTVFFNVLSIMARSAGKVEGTLKSKPSGFYKNIYGE